MSSKKIIIALTLCIHVTLQAMETNSYEVPKGQAEPELLTLTLEDQPYTFSLAPLLKHITRYQKGIDSTGQDKLLGFHHYKPTSIKELSSGITLSVVQDNLWVLALGDSTKFHKGYVIYQGKAFPKTFFPTSWDKDGIGTYIAYLLSLGKCTIKIKNHPDGLTKTYGVTLTDTNGQALHCIIHGCSLIPQSMRLITVYPLVPASPELGHLSLTLKTLAYEQMQKLQAGTKTHTSNPELIAALDKKDIERAYHLLSLDSDANVYDSKGKSALMYAATAGDWSLVNTLLEHDADALAQDSDGNTAFHYALESGDYFTALGLINPQLTNKANRQGTTPLYIALKNKNIEALELLLQFKANISLPDTFGRSPLMLAVKAYQGKADIAFCKAAISFLLQAGADVNAQDTAGNTAVHFAVESSSKELVELLINAHTCLSTRNAKNETPLTLAKKLNYTPIVMLFESVEKEKLEWLQESKGSELMYAVKTDNIPEVKKLLAQGININAQDSYGWTALTYAIEKGNNKLVTLLLDDGADPCIKLSSGHSLLSYAQSQGNTLIIEALEKKIAELETPALENKKKEQEYLKTCLARFKDDLDKNELSKETIAALPLFKNKVLNAKSGITPLLYAVKEKKHRVIQQLLERGADITAVDSQKYDALALAYAQNDLEALKILIEHSPYSRITELLIQALTQNNAEVSNLLCIQVNGLTYQALIKAIREGNQALASKLVKQPLTATEAGQAFIVALERGNSNAARLIIKECPQLVTYKDSKGITPLMYSAHHNFLELVQLLVEAGADIYAVDNNNKRARDYTSSKSPIYHYLLAQEKSFDQAKKQTQEKEAKEQHKLQLQQKGWSALAIAVSTGDTEYVKIYQGSNINATTSEGETPLLIAAKNNNEHVVSLLLNKPDINVNARDKGGYTALMYAALNDNETLVTMLLKHNVHPCIATNKKVTAYDLIKAKKGIRPSIKSALKQAQETMITNYAAKIKTLDKEVLKELWIASDLPIVFPSSYLTPELVSSLITLGYQYNLELPHDNYSSFIIKFNTIDLLRTMIDSPQVLQNNLDNALLLLAQDPTFTINPTFTVHDIAIIQLLLRAGANVNAKDNDNVTSLMHASEQGKIAFVKLLLEAHASPNEQDIVGQTALMRALFLNHYTITGILLNNADTDINAQSINGSTPLLIAAHRGDVKAVQFLLNAHAKLDVWNSDGATPLYCAAHKGHTDIVKLLLEKNARVDIKDNSGINPLIAAVNNNHNEIVRLLLDTQTDINAGDNGGNTALFYAIKNGNSEMVKLLLAAHANVNAQDSHSNTPLINASRDGHVEIIKLLLAAGAKVNDQAREDDPSLFCAVDKGYNEIVQLLLNAGANVNKTATTIGITPLINAVHLGRIEIVKFLLAQPTINVNAKDNNGRPALMYAAQKNDVAIIQLLLNAGADVNACDNTGTTTLKYTVNEGQANLSLITADHVNDREGNADIVKLLLNFGADVNIPDDSGTRALMAAAYYGHKNIVELLLKAGANVNAKDKCNRAALAPAAEQGHTTIVELLLKAGADVNAKDKINRTALAWAAEQGHTPIVELLIKAGADINVKNALGHTPLISAIASGHTETIKLLLANVDIVDIQDKEGVTALMRAASTGDSEKVKLLLDAGADPAIKDNKGQTALTYAQMSQVGEVIKLLENSMKS